MKREFLSDLFKKHFPDAEIPKAVIDAIMDENGKDAEASKTALQTAQNDLKAVQTKASDLEEQIKNRDTDIENLRQTAATSEETKKALADLQTKYDADTKDLQTKLEDQQKEAEKQLQEQALTHATESFFKDIPFASELARKAAMVDFKAAGLKLEDSGKFLGADDWIKQLRESDPAAFKPDEQEDDGNNGFVPPVFVRPTGGSGADAGKVGNETAFTGFGFTHLREPKKE